MAPASGFLPNLSRLNHRQEHFLSARRVEFLADDVFDLAQDAH